MKSAVYIKAGQVGLVEMDHPQILDPDDAIIRIVRTCVCGSDLWRYRSPDIEKGHPNSGHDCESRRFCHCSIYPWMRGL